MGYIRCYECGGGYEDYEDGCYMRLMKERAQKQQEDTLVKAERQRNNQELQRLRGKVLELEGALAQERQKRIEAEDKVRTLAGENNMTKSSEQGKKQEKEKKRNNEDKKAGKRNADHLDHPSLEELARETARPLRHGGVSEVV